MESYEETFSFLMITANFFVTKPKMNLVFAPPLPLGCVTSVALMAHRGRTIFNLGTAVLSLFSIWAVNLGTQSGQPIRAGSRWCWQSMTLGMLMVGPGTITMKSGMVTGSILCMICLCKVIKPVPRLTAQIDCPD